MTDVEVIPARDDGSLDGPRAWCHVMYGLHALSAVVGIMTSAWIVTAFLFSWPSIVAVIINYLTRDRVRGGRVMAKATMAALHLDIFGVQLIALYARLPCADPVDAAEDKYSLHRRRLLEMAAHTFPTFLNLVSSDEFVDTPSVGNLREVFELATERNHGANSCRKQLFKSSRI